MISFSDKSNECLWIAFSNNKKLLDKPDGTRGLYYASTCHCFIIPKQQTIYADTSDHLFMALQNPLCKVYGLIRKACVPIISSNSGRNRHNPGLLTARDGLTCKSGNPFTMTNAGYRTQESLPN